MMGERHVLHRVTATMGEWDKVVDAPVVALDSLAADVALPAVSHRELKDREDWPDALGALPLGASTFLSVPVATFIWRTSNTQAVATNATIGPVGTARSAEPGRASIRHKGTAALVAASICAHGRDRLAPCAVISNPGNLSLAYGV